MTMPTPIKSLLFLSVSAAMAGCTVDVEDPSNTRPVIHLDGEKTISLELNQAYSEPGYQALDAEDGDITASVLSNSAAVNTQVAGEYQITYRVTDSGDMDATPAKRLVIVAAAESTDEDSSDEDPVVDTDTGDSDGSVVVEDGDSSAPDEGDVVVGDSDTPDSTEDDSSDADDLANNVPLISSFSLLAYTAEQQQVEVTELNEGTVLDLSLMPTRLLNIEAVSADTDNTGSVHFVLDGPVTLDRYENAAIYTMQVEPKHLNLDNNELPVGDYSLTVTPYSSADMGGAKGLPKTVNFQVKDRELEVSTVPNLLAADIVVVEEGTGGLDSFARISEGYDLDLSQVPAARINILAISEDEENTGSVHFSLNGPTTIDRYENDAVYTLAPEPASLDITEDGLRNGEYTLIITPYAEADMGGEAGIPLMVNFSVSGTADFVAPTPEPEPAPEVTEPEETVNLVLNADSYSVDKGSEQQPGMTTAVSANDEFDTTSAQFSVVSQPQNGTVTMFDLGFFEYTPAPGFSGSDSFTYQVSQNGQTAEATASITVYDPQTNKGFTAIEPSADSKLIYVSSSEGSDDNTCLAAASPCKSISEALEKMRSGYPDHVYLKRGDVWRGQPISAVQSGRSPAEPAVIAFYGDSGDRPRLEHDNRLMMVNKVSEAKKHLNIIGLHFYAFKKDPKHPEFTGAYNDDANISLLTGNEDILFEDNIFDYLEITMQAWDGGSPKDMTFRRNIWTGAYVDSSSYTQQKRPSNMYASGVEGLVIEENVIDHGGWNPDVEGAGANMYNHNLYLQYSTVGNTVVVRDNIITRGSSHGVQIRAGGLVENNFFARNAVAASIGYFDKPLKAGTFARIIGNTITEGHSMYKGKDACNGNNLCTSAVYGISGNDYGEGEITVSDNIIHGEADNDEGWRVKYSGLMRHPFRMGEVEPAADNIAWDWGKTTDKEVGSYPAPGRTLADYNAYLGGEKSFEAFMDIALTRPLQTWDEKYSADSINKYIKAGFGK